MPYTKYMEKMEKAKFNPKNGLITFYSASIISLKRRYAHSKSGTWPVPILKGRRLKRMISIDPVIYATLKRAIFSICAFDT